MEESWSRSHGGGTMEDASWRMHHGGVNIEEASRRRQLGGGSQEAGGTRRHPGGSQDAPRSVSVSVFVSVPTPALLQCAFRPEAPVRSRTAFERSEVTTSAKGGNMSW